MQTLAAVARTLGISEQSPSSESASAPDAAAFPSEQFLLTYMPLSPVYSCPGILAHQAADVFAMWNAWEQRLGRQCEVPFWGVVWPGAIVLARYLIENQARLAGASVLDLGCGSGIAGIAAAKCGAERVIANDIDPVALHLTSLNAAANDAEVELSPANLVECDIVSPDLVLVGDMFYQRDASRRMLEFLKELRGRGAEVLIADGNRPFAPKTDIEVLCQDYIPVNLELEGLREREVRLLRLAR